MVCGAGNYGGLSYVPKLETRTQVRLVGERCVCSEALAVRLGGVHTSENAGMSSERPVRSWPIECPRFPPQCKSSEG